MSALPTESNIPELFKFESMNFKKYKESFIQNEYWRNRDNKQKEILNRHKKLKNFSMEIVYFILCLIYSGKKDLKEINSRVIQSFLAFSEFKLITDLDFQKALNYIDANKLAIKNENEEYNITKDGRDYIDAFYLNLAHGNFWFRKIATEKMVMIVTAIFLLILATLKIIIGIQLESNAMQSEGLENLTDLIKIGIIFIGIKFNKDRFASILIIGMMIITGISVAISGISALINPVEIIPSVQGFLIVILSLAMNGVLLVFKGYVGRISGNLALLSDSKDSLVNIQISSGVLIGLIFSIFDLYIVDSIVGIIIGILCVVEGIEIMKELMVKEEEFDITTFKVTADTIYNHKISLDLMNRIKNNQYNREDLLKSFNTGLKNSIEYFGGFSYFFYEDLKDNKPERFLNELIDQKFVTTEKIEDSNRIDEKDRILKLTDEGNKFFLKETEWESKKRKKTVVPPKYPKLRYIAWMLSGWAVFITIIALLIVYTDKINAFFLNP